MTEKRPGRPDERLLLDLAQRLAETESALLTLGGGAVDAVFNPGRGCFTLLCGAQTALLESEEQFRLIAEHSADLISMVSAEGRFLYLSPSHESVLGYPRDRLMTMQPDDLVHPEDRLRVQERDPSELVEFRARRADGSWIWLEGLGYPVTWKNQPCLVGIARDITQRKQIAERLNLYSKVFESAAEGIFITDASPRIIAANPAFTSITGYAAADVVGRAPRLLKAEHLQDDEYAEIWHVARETGRWQGEVWNRAKSGEVYPQWLSLNAVPDERGQVTHFVAVFSNISERKAEEDRVRFLAQHDPLTGLPNRNLLKDRLAQAIASAHRNRDQVAVLFLDLDRFKVINDTLGHRAGDLLLCSVAERLKSCVREQDTVARLGGDEFVVVVPQIGHAHDPAYVARKILRTLVAPHEIEGERLSVGSSVGISVYPYDSEDAETLLRHADEAMYQSKTSGNRYEFYTAALTRRAIERMELEEALRFGIANGQLQLYYQPKLDLATETVSGAEALLRWCHPEWGLVMPKTFLSVAEESGLIESIGNWALQTACKQNKHWQDAGLPAIPVAVNLSRRQFKREPLVATVRTALNDAGLDPRYLELDLTEPMMMGEVEETAATLRELKSIGVLLSVDDFGTGYSSLGLLQRFPLDSLKIDQSFVAEIDGGKAGNLVSAVISLAHTLHLTVTAEGVGTRGQVQYLRRHGCDAIQGYFSGRPLHADAFATYLGNGPAARLDRDGD